MDIISIPKPIFYPASTQTYLIESNNTFNIKLDSEGTNAYVTVKFITKNNTNRQCTYFKKKFLIRETAQEDKNYKVFSDESLSIITRDKQVIITNHNGYTVQLNYEVKKIFYLENGVIRF